MKLYHFPRSRSARVLWAANELGAKLDIIPVNLLEGEHRKAEYGVTHPHHKVPAFADATRDLHMIESGAIAVWLQEIADTDNSLIPERGTAARGRYWEWLFYVNSTLDNIVIPAYLHSKILPEPARDEQVVTNNAEVWNTDAAPFVAKRLGDGTWACGGQFTIADVFLTYDLVLAMGLGWLEAHPALRAYVGRATAREGFKAAFS